MVTGGLDAKKEGWCAVPLEPMERFSPPVDGLPLEFAAHCLAFLLLHPGPRSIPICSLEFRLTGG